MRDGKVKRLFELQPGDLLDNDEVVKESKQDPRQLGSGVWLVIVQDRNGKEITISGNFLDPEKVYNTQESEKLLQ